MKSSRHTVLALGQAALLVVAFSWLPLSALACGDKDEACACGAACPSEQMGSGDAAAGDQQKAGACACGAASAASAAAAADAGPTAAGAAPMHCDHAAMAGEAKGADSGQHAGAGQRAVIDPATGQLTVPADGEGVGADSAAPAPGAAASAQGSAQGGVVTQSDGAVLAAFPKDRASKAVANVDESGNAHAACSE